MSDVLAEYRTLESRLLAAFRAWTDDAEFEDLALAVHAFQRRWNGPYSAYADRTGAPKSWLEIPAVPQTAFKRASLSCVPRELIGKTFRTSGTTGESRGEHHFLDLRLYEAA